jgi:2-polyprenyl-3-methyl-5-hydroxy-6-metoxy-1,4-benzoquinol methylase
MPLDDADQDFIASQTLDVAWQLLTALTIGLDQRLRPLLDQLADLRQMLIEERAPPNTIELRTGHPVALASNDHTHPWGAKNDNTRSARFCRAIERHFRRNLVALDLGCSGGGLVFDFLVRGHLAIGLEGSDYSLRAQRAEWRVIGPWLRTCDITKPFELHDTRTGRRQAFDVVTMWEVLEHIREDDLAAVFHNVVAHLREDGLFVGSIALGDDVVDGVSYHPTVRPREWWRATFAAAGLSMIEPTMFDVADFCRGTGNGPMDPDFAVDPARGFHFVARLAAPGRSAG